MAGQGSLCQRIFHSRCPLSASALLCAFLATQFAFAPSASPAADDAALIDVRLRCQWESKDARLWKVRLSIRDVDSRAQSISEVENHSASDRTTGAFELSGDARTLDFQPRHQMQGGAVQLRVRASREAKISIEMFGDRDSSIAQPPKRELLLTELLEQQIVRSDNAVEEDSSNAPDKPSWQLRRIAGDQLRIENLRSVPIYEPGSQLDFSVRSNALVQSASRSLTLQYSLYRVSHGETVTSHRWSIKVDPQGNSEPITVNESVPELPGVYEIRCQLAKDDDNIWSRLRRADPPLVRVGRPIVVLPSEEDPQRSESEAWGNVGVIRPSESSWSVGKWLPKPTSRFIPGSNLKKPGPESTGDLSKQEYAGESISLIQPRDSFQATLPVLTPGLPHKVTIRYPTAHMNKLRVDVAGTNDRATPAFSFALASDPVAENVNGWRTHTFVHYPAGDDQIWLTNLDPSAPAAFESISVQAGPSHLAKKLQRLPGHRKTILKLADIEWVNSLSSDVTQRTGLSDCDPATIALYRLWIASDRVRDYALAIGMNGIMVPANSGGRAWFDSTALFPRRDASTQDGGRLATLMRLMERSDLDVFVTLQPSMLLSDPERAIRQQRTCLHELARNHSGHGDHYNLLHPLIHKSLASLVGQLVQQCSHYECFAGIALHCDEQSHLRPLRQGFDDTATLALFARSHVATMSPVQLRTWAGGPGKTEFDTWLRDETRRTFELVGGSATQKPVLMVMHSLSTPKARIDADSLEIEPFADQWRGERGNLVPTESYEYGIDRVLASRSLLQQKLSSISGPRPGTAAMIGQEIDPDSSDSAPVRSRLRADVSRIVDRADPSILVVELPLMAHRFHDDFAQLFRSYAAMTTENTRRINPIDPTAQTVRVHSRTNDGHLYVSMISLVPWSSEVELESSKPVEWLLIGGTTESPDEEPIRKMNEARARVLVPAGQIVLLKSMTPTNATIKPWSTRLSRGSPALEKIKRDVTLIVERIGILSDFDSYDALANGGFEQSGGMGLVGWLHAQHPPGCVRIDDKEFLEGKHAVLLTTDAAAATRTWIVSETIDPPQSQRLAVSLACRGELKQDNSVHRLRVSIEATRNGVPIRYSSEFDVPRNGQWGSRGVVLEADGIDASAVDSLRLTIDSLSGGRVWIDDVRLHDQFPTAKERAELQSQAFLAVQGLQRGNLTPSGRLLQNHWARRLLTLGPAQHSKRVIEAVEAVEETPGVAERLRSWLPRPLRF